MGQVTARASEGGPGTSVARDGSGARLPPKAHVRFAISTVLIFAAFLAD